MKMNSKGFSMVELLAVVAILGILSTIGITAVSNILEKAHEEYYINQEKNLVLAAQSFMRSNQNRLPKVVGKKEKVTAKELREANYLKKDITRYDGKTKCKDDKTYVNVYKYGINDYSYTAYLTCPDDKVAAEEEKAEKPKIDAVFPGSKEDVATASIKITFDGEENNPETKLLSYSYSVFVIENGKSVELLNTGTMQVRQPKVEKTIKLSKYAINSTEVILKVKATATNIKGNSTSKIFTNDYKDKTPPTCEYINKEDDPKGLFRRKTWVNRDVKVTVRCNDGNGSGCEKDTYTKTFTSNGGVDYIKMSDNVGNKYRCPVVKFIDKTSPTVIVKAYKCNSSGEASGDELKSVTASGNTQTINSSDLAGNVNGWLNKANYPNGVCFTFDVEDGSALKSTSWKWNKDGLKRNASGYTTLNGGNIDETFTIDDGYSLTTSRNYKHSLSAEGHRYASFVVEDGIGNKSIVNVNMLIDRTNPTDPTVAGFKKNNSTDISSSAGLDGYTFNTWYKGWVLVTASGSTDNISEVEGYYLTTSGQSTDANNIKQAYRNVGIVEGSATIKFRARDNAGNYSNYVERIVKLDRKAPTDPTVTGYKKPNDTTYDCSASWNTSGTYTDSTWYSGYVITKASGSTDGGVGGVKYYLTTTGQNDNVTNSNQNCRNVHKQGTVTNTYKVCDELDNCTAAKTITIKLDRTAPEITITAADVYYYTLSAVATDSLSGVDKVRWGGNNYSDVANSSSVSIGSISGVTTDGSRHAFAIDVAGNETDKETTAYKLFNRTVQNTASRAYKVGETQTNNTNCSKGADQHNDEWKNHPYKCYDFDFWDCKCTYDYYNGAFKSYDGNTKRTGPGTHHSSSTMCLYYQNTDNGVSACKGDIPKNTYVWDVCHEGSYPINSAAHTFHGYRWYNSSKPADETYSNWHKKTWYHDDYQKDNRVAYSSSVGVACEHSCKIAGQHGTYANG